AGGGAGGEISAATQERRGPLSSGGRPALLKAAPTAAAASGAGLRAGARLTPRLHLRTTRALRGDWLANVSGARALDGTGSEALVEITETAGVAGVLRAAADAGGDVLELVLHRPSLADVFFALTGHGLRDDESPAAAAR